MSPQDEHLFRQAREGEFALLSSQAKTMTATQFAAAHGADVKPAAPGGQDRVTVDGCDYFWSPVTGQYDGWGRAL
jgi:hypothetical protein